jgi:hypothetical protein
MDAKIDMLHRSGMIGKTPGKAELSLRKSGESDARVWGPEEVSRMVLLPPSLSSPKATVLCSCQKKMVHRKMITSIA